MAADADGTLAQPLKFLPVQQYCWLILWWWCEPRVPHQQSSHLTLAISMWSIRHGTWVSYRLEGKLPSYFRSSSRIGCLIGQDCSCVAWTTWVHALPKMTKLPRKETSWGSRLQETISWFNNELTTAAISLKKVETKWPFSILILKNIYQECQKKVYQ